MYILYCELYQIMQKDNIDKYVCECGTVILKKPCFMINNTQYCTKCFVKEFNKITDTNKNNMFNCALCSTTKPWNERFHIYDINFCSMSCINKYREIEDKNDDSKKAPITRYFRSDH